MSSISEPLLQKAKQVQCLICDIDGVLTNGIIYMTPEGTELRAFHVHDGMGLKLLMTSGIEVAVITTSRVSVIDHRMKQLGIKHYYRGQVSKVSAYEDLKKKLNLQDHQFAYIGDDLPDWEIMKQVGLSIAVSNAVETIIERADWTTHKKGGKGAVREVCNMLMALHQSEENALKNYLTLPHNPSEALQ